LISQNIAISKVSLKLGYFSYGIYLSHALITAGFLPVMNKLFPQMLSFQLSPLMLILSSSVIFTLSLVMTYLISLNKTAAKVLLAA
jgi:peptidoglycan/LPS O-acetylase OafA/YrhL